MYGWVCHILEWSAPPMRSLSQAIISASRTTFFLILAEHGRESVAELPRPSTSLMMPCTPSRSIVESFPLLLKIVIFGFPLEIWTWICARSPSYLVSAQTLADSWKCNKAFAHPVPFTDLGSYQTTIVYIVSIVPIWTTGNIVLTWIIEFIIGSSEGFTWLGSSHAAATSSKLALIRYKLCI